MYHVYIYVYILYFYLLNLSILSYSIFHSNLLNIYNQMHFYFGIPLLWILFFLGFIHCWGAGSGDEKNKESYSIEFPIVFPNLQQLISFYYNKGCLGFSSYVPTVF